MRRSATVLSAHNLFQQGIAAILRGHGYHIVEGGKRVELALVDLDHPVGDPATFARHARIQHAGAYLVAIGHPTRLAAVAAKADAELELPHADAVALLGVAARRSPKPSAELAAARRAWSAVTPRQRDVLRWLAIGLDNAAIASKLRVGDRAIKAHISALLELFDLDNRAQLALLGAEAGFGRAA